MRYPDGRCKECGERQFTTASGCLWCLNCAERSSADRTREESATQNARAD